MRYLLFLIFFAACTPVSADIFVLYEAGTNQVISVDKDDTAVVRSGQEKVIIPGDIDLTYPPSFYRLQGKRLVVDRAKVDTADLIRQKQERKEVEMRIVEQAALKRACEELVAAGSVFNEINCTQFGGGQ